MLDYYTIIILYWQKKKLGLDNNWGGGDRKQGARQLTKGGPLISTVPMASKFPL